MIDRRKLLLADTIEESRWILKLEDNWDNNDAVSYKQCTWERATRLVKNIYDSRETKYQLPSILPGPDGSIDLYWKSSKYEAIVNVPPKEDENIELYGCSTCDIIIVSGRFSDDECVEEIKLFFGRLDGLKDKE
jgi:hypothetical protein